MVPGADLHVPILGVDRAVEVKCRAAGFSELYDWLNDRDGLIVKADRQEPLVVLRMSLAAEIANAAFAADQKAIRVGKLLTNFEGRAP